MVEMRKFIVKCGLYIACCFLFVNVQALTLTEAELKSRLNQTLNARIGISGVTDEDMNSLVIGVPQYRGNEVPRVDTDKV